MCMQNLVQAELWLWPDTQASEVEGQQASFQPEASVTEWPHQRYLRYKPSPSPDWIFSESSLAGDWPQAMGSWQEGGMGMWVPGRQGAHLARCAETDGCLLSYSWLSAL